MLTAIDWAIKELLFLSFLRRLFAIELYGVTGGLMPCECDRKQMRCALTAPLHHCWTANVRSQTACVQDDKREERGVWAMFYGFESVYVSVICLWLWQMCTCLTIWIACWNIPQVIQGAGTFYCTCALCLYTVGALNVWPSTHGSPGASAWTEVSLSVSVTGKNSKLVDLRPEGGQWGMDEDKQMHFAQAWNAFQGMWTEIRREGERRRTKVTERRRGGGKSEWVTMQDTKHILLFLWGWVTVD